MGREWAGRGGAASGVLNICCECGLGAQMWMMPNVTSEQHKTYGGTLVSKYNRGRMGQFFINLEHSGDLFFHREVRSNPKP